MQRALTRPLLLIAFAALLLFIGGALVLDGNRYKLRLIETFEQATQRKFTLKGDLRFTVLPPGIEMQAGTIAEPHSERVFARFERLAFRLKLLPLLQGEWIIDGLEADGVTLTLRRNEDGSSNFDDLLQLKDSGKLHWALRHIDIKAPSLELLDEHNLPRWQLQNASLSGEPGGNGDSVRLSLQGDVVHQLFAGRVLISGEPVFDSTPWAMRLPDLKLTWIGLATGAPSKLELTGSFDYATRAALLHGASVRFAAGDGNHRLQVAGNLPYGEWSGGRFKADKLTLDGELVQAQRNGRLSVHWSNIRAGMDGLRADSRIDFNFTHERRAFLLSLFGPLLLQTDTGRFTLPELALNAELRDPKQRAPLSTFQLKGVATADWLHQAVAARFEGNIDGAPMKLAADMNDFGSPRYLVDAELSRLDITPYLLIAAPAEPKADDAKAEESRADSAPLQTVDFSLFEDLRAQGTLRIGALTIGRLHLSALDVGLKADEKGVALAPMKARLYGGQLNGKAFLKLGETPELTLEQSLSNLDIAALLNDVPGLGNLDGRGNAKLALTAHGHTLEAWRQRLLGTAEFGLTGGAIRGINLGKILGLARQSSAAGAQKSDLSARTEFSELHASFKIANGIARNDDLSLQSPLLKLSGAGEFDLGANQMDYAVNAEVVANASTVGLGALRGVVVPVHIRGQIDAPGYNVDLNPVLERLARNATEAADSNRKKPAGPVIPKPRPKLKPTSTSRSKPTLTKTAVLPHKSKK